MTEKFSYAELILPLPLEGTFTYLIPEEFSGKVIPGIRVVVHFGKKKFYSALVQSLHNHPPVGIEVKAIESILDDTPVIQPVQFDFWNWMSVYYHCSPGEVMKVALPSGLKLESETRIIFNPDYPEKVSLTAREELAYNLISGQKSLSILQLNAALGKINSLPLVKSLLAKGAIKVEEKLKGSYKPRFETYLCLEREYQNEAKLNDLLNMLGRARKQQELLMVYLSESRLFSSNPKPEIQRKVLMEKAGTSASVLTGLIKKGVFRILEKPIDRLARKDVEMQLANDLNEHQKNAFDSIKNLFLEHTTVLLHGVTSSGKTEIFIKLIEEHLKLGKQVLYLVPEIALTAQTINRLELVFGKKAGIYHSKFNDAEKVEIWNKVLQFDSGVDSENDDSYQIILGARSAVFLPFKNLGLIIIDEEHENSFKQYDPAPRYHARDAAIVLAHQQKAKVLLGTATPSLESYFNAKTGKYGLVELKHRYKGIELPEIITADVRDAYKRKQMKSHFTPLLFDAIREALDHEEQVILFQNRRGFSPFIQCKSCGWIPKCKDCDVSLTYHKHNQTLVCHYCGYHTRLPLKCNYCGSEEVQTKGFGTEKIEDEISLFFPDAKVGRMDMDTTRAKLAYERIINDFEAGRINILIGTQMVTKGLDFENVSIVGILNADNLLNYPDYRSFERSFQLMAQVSGRAGRKHKRGKVIIQTSEPGHPVIIDVMNNNYQNLFYTQIEERKLFKYPPYYRMIALTLKHHNREMVDKVSAQLAYELRKVFGRRVLGPEYPAVSRIQKWHQKRIWIKMEKSLPAVKTKNRMQEVIDEVRSRKENRTVQVIVDVDPQ